MINTAVIDADFIRFAAASVGEKRTVKVVHKKTGDERVVKTRTEWYGHWAKKNGGLLAEINSKLSGDSKLSPDDFEYIDQQTVDEPISNVLHSCKLLYNNAVKAVGASKSKGFLGQGQNFRHDRATILEYKGNRKELIRPLLMGEVGDYMIKHLGCEMVEGVEADDVVIIESFRKPDHVVISVDKDSLGQPVNSFNPNKPDLGVINCNQFGKLYLNSKGEVTGYGRMHHYFQVCSQDDSDNYAANSASDTKWGAKSAYKALVGCSNDKEAFEAMRDIYKKLYPEAKTIIGWRGDEIEIDWKYVINENWELSRMLRTLEELDNRIICLDVMDKLGVTY